MINGFFQLRVLSKVKACLPAHDSERVIHIFIASIDYCNCLALMSCYFCLRAVKNVATRLLRKKRNTVITLHLIMAYLHWLPISFRINWFKISLLVFKSLSYLVTPYLTQFVQTYTLKRELRSTNQLLNITKSRLKSRGNRPGYPVCGGFCLFVLNYNSLIWCVCDTVYCTVH